MRRFAAAAVLAFAGTATPIQAASPAAHAPQTAAVKALDKVLDVADRDDEVLDDLLHRYPVPPAKRIDYAKWLTADLLASLRAEEKKLVDKDCGGKYREGDICGMDFNPLTCAQDTVQPMKFRTLSQNADVAVIARDDASYRMVRTASGWKLDGVKCGGDAKFNFP